MNRTFRNTLAQLEMLSHGAVQKIDSDMTHGGERDQSPKGEKNPPHITFRVRWEACRTVSSRREVEDDAVLFLQAWRGQVKPKPVKEADWRTDVLDEMKGLTPKQIVLKVGGLVSERQVIEWRTEEGLDPYSGETAPGKETSRERRERVLRLFNEGNTPARIALMTGSSRQAVSQMIQRHRKAA